MKNIPQINTTKIIEARRRQSGQVINPKKLRKVNKTPESSDNNRTHHYIRDIHSQTLQNSTISFDQTSMSVHRLFKNKEDFSNYMLHKKYISSKNQYHKVIVLLSDIENKIKENNEIIDKMKNYLNKLKQNKKQKQIDIVNLLSNKESLEEIYKSKIYHLRNKSQIFNINNPNNPNNPYGVKNKNNKNENNKDNKNEQNRQINKNRNNNENNDNNNNTLFNQNSTINLFEDNNFDVSIEEIRLSDKKKYEEQIIIFAEEILQKKNKELRNRLREKIYLAYQIFSSEYNSVSDIDQSTIISNFFTRISLFISNQSLGNYSEQFINSFLRHLIKINYIGVEISQILKFLNKKYKEIKLEVKERISNLTKRNENYKNKKISYETKREELKKFIEENKDIRSYDRSRMHLDDDNHNNSHYFSFISDTNFTKTKTCSIKSNEKKRDRIKNIRTKIPKLKSFNKNQINNIKDDNNKVISVNKREKYERKSADANSNTFYSKRLKKNNETNENNENDENINQNQNQNNNKILKIKNIKQISNSFNLNLENPKLKKKNINEIVKKPNKKLNMNKIFSLNNYQINNTWNNSYNNGIEKKTDGSSINIGRFDNVENLNMNNKQIINVNNLLINNNINIENNNIINNNSKNKIDNNKTNNNLYLSDNRKISTHRRLNIRNTNIKNDNKKFILTDNINDNFINGLVRNGFNNSITDIKYNKNKKIINSKLNDEKNDKNNNYNFHDILGADGKKQNSKSIIMLNDTKSTSQKNINSNKSMNLLNSPMLAQKKNYQKRIIIPKENTKSEIIYNNKNITYNSKTVINRMKSPKSLNEFIENKSKNNRSPINTNNNALETSTIKQSFFNKNSSYNTNTYISKKDELKNRKIDISIIEKNSIYSKRYDNRLKVLTQGIKDSFCYFKISNKDIYNFDPLDNCSSTPENFGYIDGYISIDVLNHKFKISPKNPKDLEDISLSDSNSNEEENENKYNIGIELKDIVDIVLSKHMKNIIRIYNAYTKHSVGQENANVNRFIYSRELNDIPMEQNERIKAAFCNFFMFSLIVGKKNIPKVEFIFINYEHFNLWFNCLQYICKFNSQVPNMISCRTYNPNANGSPNKNKK